MNTNNKIESIATDIANRLNNEIEYQLTVGEYYKLRDAEYKSLVSKGLIKDNDDNFDDFDSFFAGKLKVDWGY
jgi:hypothetical protein